MLLHQNIETRLICSFFGRMNSFQDLVFVEKFVDLDLLIFVAVKLHCLCRDLSPDPIEFLVVCA